jgi:hypothetical protein
VVSVEAETPFIFIIVVIVSEHFFCLAALDVCVADCTPTGETIARCIPAITA